MASAFGHALVGYTFSKILDKKQSKLLIALAVISSILPDADVLAFRFGIPYEHWLGHRGFTHSFFFSFIWALFVAMLFGKEQKRLFFVVVFLATISHAILDAMTNGGLGVGFFIPISDERYFLLCRPIQVSPLGIERFFSKWGWRVICSELIWIGTPSLILLFLNKKINK